MRPTPPPPARVKAPPRPEAEILAELQALCISPGYVHALAYLCYRDNVVLFADELTEQDLYKMHLPERVIRTEINTLLGLMIKAPIDWTLPSPDKLQRYLDETERLLGELHRRLSAAFSFDDVLAATSRGESFNPLQSAEVLREPIFYAADSAYDFQYLDFATRRYAADAPWLEANVGFTIDQACVLAEAMQRNMEARLERMRAQLPALPLDQWTALPAFCASVTELADLTGQDPALIKRILDKFCVPVGATNADFAELQDFNLATAAPLLRTPNGEYMSLQAYALAEAIYESPFYWMLADKPYRATQVKNRGAFTEDFLADRLKRVFGADYVLTNINIYKGKDVVAEIDVLVLWADRAIIVQGKSKRLTLEARKGNDQIIRKDFQHSVQDAYDQGLLCAECIGSPAFRFVHSDGTDLVLPAIFEIFMFCVVSDHYPALSMQTRQFLKPSQLPRVRAALVTDLFLVDVMTELLSSPLHFLSYVARRARYGDRVLATHELTVLGYHLAQNLWLDKETDLLQIGEDFTAGVDVAMAVRRRGLPGAATPKGLLTLYEGTTLSRVLHEIEARAEPAILEQGFQLLEMSSEAWSHLNFLIDRQANRSVQDGQPHNGAMPFPDGSGFSFVCSPDDDVTAAEHLEHICSLRKYAQMADRWFGMCLTPAPARLRFGVRMADPWQQDDAMDALTSNMREAIPMRQMRQRLAGAIAAPKVGRNNPCPCGSGKKWKKCHGA